MTKPTGQVPIKTFSISRVGGRKVSCWAVIQTTIMSDGTRRTMQITVPMRRGLAITAMHKFEAKQDLK